MKEKDFSYVEKEENSCFRGLVCLRFSDFSMNFMHFYVPLIGN